MGKAARDIWMELPEEDKVHNDDIVPMVGKLERSMYGTMDASKIFQEDWQNHLSKHGGEVSALCTSLFKFKDRGLLGLVHGDDFLVVGDEAGLKWMDEMLNSRYTARWEATLGER